VLISTGSARFAPQSMKSGAGIHWIDQGPFDLGATQIDAPKWGCGFHELEIRIGMMT
jgi:hypothetical protein